MQNYNEKYEEFKYEIISETKDGKLKQLYWNIAFLDSKKLIILNHQNT